MQKTHHTYYEYELRWGFLNVEIRIAKNRQNINYVLISFDADVLQHVEYRRIIFQIEFLFIQTEIESLATTK